MAHMGLPLKLLSTAAAGAVDVWVGIITGVALGLSPALSGTVSIVSAVVGVTLVVVAGERLQRLIYRSRHLAKRRERIERVWKRYGIPGLACKLRCSRDRSWRPYWRWASGRPHAPSWGG